MQEVRVKLACGVWREEGFSCLGYPAVTAESASAVRGREQKGVLRKVSRLAVTGGNRFLPQPLNEAAGFRMTIQKARNRLWRRLTGSGVRELRSQEPKKVLRRPRGKSFDRERQDVGVLPFR